MKNVLIIGHFWPYHKGGSKRMLGLAKYLVEFGWQPIIVSGKLHYLPEQKFTIFETQTSNRIKTIKKCLMLNSEIGIQEQLGIPINIRERPTSCATKIVKSIEAVLTFPDVEYGWKKYALQACRYICLSEKISCVISVWPIVSHLVAKEIKLEFNIPWLSDFPDMWAFTYAYRYGKFRQFLDKQLEISTIKKADEIITSSWPQSKLLEQLHNRKHVHTIKIGYDPDRENLNPAPLTKKFSITYTGVLYGAERNPDKLLNAVYELKNNNLIDCNDFEVRFYGHVDVQMDERLKNLHLENIVKQFGFIPWEECLKKQRESQILLQLNWENPAERGAYSGKIAEYLAARRPVISVGGFGNDVIEELFSETNIGTYCITVDETKKALYKYYLEYKESGSVNFVGNITNIQRYSYREMAKRFVEIMKNF